MTKWSKLVDIIWNTMRLTRQNLRKKADISWQGKQFLSPGCQVEVLDGKLRLGPRVTIERWTYLGVQDQALLDIGENVYINRNCNVVARKGITIGKGVTIGPGCQIYDHNHDIDHFGAYTYGAIVIGEDTWIGAGCILLPGVTIGEQCVIGAGTVVTHDIPANTIVYQKRETTEIARLRE